MITPEYLDKLNYNKVIDIYDKLNIDICSDIIKRIEKLGDLSSYTKAQIKTIISTGGKELLEENLLKINGLSSEVKQEVYKIFEDMAKEDLIGYKELYEYREKELKLTSSQLKILNEGAKLTNKELKNFTKTLAFSSKQLYVNAVDRAYFQVVTGGIDYNTAIYNAYKELASKGLKIKDSAGRNVNIDVAVRRNILTGIKQTSDNINKDVDDYLGCDGVETTAHISPRPSHAIWQGKQFAKTKEGAKKFGIGLWDTISSELNDYGCRHTYFGIILGISKPVYTNKELNTLENKKVSLNGVKVPYYEATETARYIERNIREYKRQVDILKSSNQDYSQQQSKVRQWQKKYRDFSKETGIDIDYTRTRI